MFSGNKNKSGRKKLKPLYLAEGGFSLTPPGSSFGGTSTSSKTKTTVPFPKTAAEYMKTIGANPKYKNLDSSKILQIYSKDKSSWPKSLDIIEENCSETGTCGKTLKYSISPTPATYNWGSRGSTTAVKPKTTTSTTIKPVSTATKTTGTTPVSTPVSTPTVIPTNNPVVPPAAKTPIQTPIQTTAPGRPYLMQRFNYMTPEDRQRAVSFYGKIENVPTQGVDIYQLRRDVPKVPTFKSGGTSCPEGKTWSAELNRCVSSYEANYVKGLKKDREDIIGLYRTGADKALIDARTQAFKQKYKKESGEAVQLFCDKYDCKIPPETFSSTTTTNTNTPSFNIKGIISDQYVPDVKNPNSREWRYRIETDKGFDILPSKKAFDEWKEKYKSAYQPYYEKSNRITPGTQNTVDYNKGRINEYLEKPTLKYEETPKLVKKRGGEIKNDKAMVSGVSSILRKIKDKDNRKEVAGDMVKQFNREGVNYNKEKFLKNSRSFQGGGPYGVRKTEATGIVGDKGFTWYNNPQKINSLIESAYTKQAKPIYTYDKNDPRLQRFNDSDYLFKTASPERAKRLITSKNYQEATAGNENFDTRTYWQVLDRLGNPKQVADVRKKFGKNSVTETFYKQPQQPIIYKSAVQYSKPNMQRYNYMSVDDQKRAIKKYGSLGKVPTYVDLNQLRKEVPTFKKGGQHGGLDRWFAEKWVDVKSGKPCGRQEGENRAYPACRPSKRISSKTPKTSSELSSKEKARFKATKTSSQRIPYNHKRK
jgi:hypothetical protein